MKENEFDKFIRERLQQQPSDVPADMWQRITEARKKKRDRKIFFWLFFAILITGSAVYVRVPQLGHRELKKFVPVSATTVSTDSITTGHHKINLPPTPALKQQKMHRDTTSFLAVHNIITDAQTRGNFVKQSAQKLSKTIARKKAPAHPQQTRRLKSKPAKNASPINTQPIIASASAPTNTEQNSTPATTHDSVTIVKVETSAAIVEPTEMHDHFILEILASPTFAMQQVQAENHVYESQLRSAFSTRPGFSFGLRVGYEISDKWFAKTGVQYVQLKARLQFEDSLMSFNTARNTYRSVSVPLLLCFQPSFQKNVSMQFSAGILLNIGSEYRGNTFSPLGNQLDFEQDRVYKSTMDASAYTAVSINYRLKNRVDVFAEPWLTIRLGNEANNMMDFRQKLHAAGLAVGARYRLFQLQMP